MITGYIEYKNKKNEVKDDFARKWIGEDTIEDLHDIEVFETNYPEMLVRYEEEQKNIYP